MTYDPVGLKKLMLKEDVDISIIKKIGDLPSTISFINLSDTPTAFTGDANKLCSVNATEDALEFIAVTSLDHDTLNNRTHDGDTLQFDGLNSDGGNFDFISSGSLNLKLSGDTDDYLQFFTSVNQPHIKVIGGANLYLESDDVNNLTFYLWQSVLAYAELHYSKSTDVLNISSTGTINIRPSSDSDDYVSFLTTSNVPIIQFIGDDGEIQDVKVINDKIYYVSTAAEFTAAISDIESNNYYGVIHILDDLTDVRITLNDASASYIIDGHGHTLDANGDNTIITISNADFCLLKNFQIDVTDFTVTTSIAISINEASNNPVFLDNLSIVGDGTNGIGIDIASKYCIVENSHFLDLSYGVHATDTYQRIINCFFQSTNIYAIHLNASTHTIIEGNIILGDGKTSSAGIYLQNHSDYCTISGNNISSHDNGILLQSYGTMISANTIRLNKTSGININGCNETVVSGNWISDNLHPTQGHGIYLSNADLNHISSNFISENSSTGIFMYNGCAYNEIIGNQCREHQTNTYKSGIYLNLNCDNNFISGNQCYDNTTYGIRIQSADCNNNRIVGNYLTGNGTDLSDAGTGTEYIIDELEVGVSQGDVLYASAADTLSWLAKGNDNEFFVMNGNVPNWEALDISLDSSPQLGGNLDCQQYQLLDAGLLNIRSGAYEWNVSLSTTTLTIAPDAFDDANDVLLLDSKVEIGTNAIGNYGGSVVHTLLYFHPTVSWSSWTGLFIIYDETDITFDTGNLIAYWAELYAAPTLHYKTTSNFGQFRFFTAAPTIIGEVNSVDYPDITIYDDISTLLYDNITSAGFTYVSYQARPTFEANGASGDMTGTDYYGFYSAPRLETNNATAVVAMDDVIHFQVINAFGTGAGTETVTQQVGLYIDQLNKATTNYGIFIEGASQGAIVLDNDGIDGRILFGADQDAYIEFDGNSLNLKANSVTGADIILLDSDVQIAAGYDLDCNTLGAYFKPRRVSQSAEPTPDTGELLLWRDTDDDKTYLVYNDTDVGVRKIELT